MLIDLLQSLLSAFLHPFQLTLGQVIWVLIVPLTVDLPRTLGKTIFLLAHGAYERLTLKTFEYIQPLVSVIVPAHNEEEMIEKSIESLVRQDYPRKEIIVVDDGSTDRTYEKVSKFAKDGLVKLVRREEASGKKARAVNYGTLYSSGDIVVVVDADTLLEPHSLSELIKPFRDPAVGAVSGNIRVLNRTNLLTRLQAYEYTMAMEVGRRFQAITGMLMIIPGAFGAIRRSLAASLGLYDPDTITEDFDITVKIHKAKMKVKFAVSAIGCTTTPQSWRAWTKQRMRWTAGQLQTLFKHRDIFFRRYFGAIGLISTPDMLFMDIVVLFVRAAWLVALPFLYLDRIPVLFVLVFLFYLFSELTIALSAALLSPRKRDMVYLYLVPVVVLFYRPLYSLVRMRAYFNVLSGQTLKW